MKITGARDKYLCSGRRDWISRAGVHFDGAGARGGVPCVRVPVQAACGFDAADGIYTIPEISSAGGDGRLV